MFNVSQMGRAKTPKFGGGPKDAFAEALGVFRGRTIIIVLLCAGNQGSQAKDIKTANGLANEWSRSLLLAS